MLNSKNYDFSFSGLKTAVMYLVKNLKTEGKSIKKILPEIAYEFENAVSEVLTTKTARAAKEYKAKSVILGGGVAANKRLRHELDRALRKHLPQAKFFAPDAAFTGDNAAMIAVAAYFNAVKKTKNWKSLTAKANLKI